MKPSISCVSRESTKGPIRMTRSGRQAAGTATKSLSRSGSDSPIMLWFFSSSTKSSQSVFNTSARRYINDYSQADNHPTNSRTSHQTMINSFSLAIDFPFDLKLEANRLWRNQQDIASHIIYCASGSAYCCDGEKQTLHMRFQLIQVHLQRLFSIIYRFHYRRQVSIWTERHDIWVNKRRDEGRRWWRRSRVCIRQWYFEGPCSRAWVIQPGFLSGNSFQMMTSTRWSEQKAFGALARA